MRQFNYSLIKDQKWDSELLGLIAAIYREAGKQEMYLKQRPQELEKLSKYRSVKCHRRNSNHQYPHQTACRRKNYS